jgi:hypothetical protein
MRLRARAFAFPIEEYCYYVYTCIAGETFRQVHPRAKHQPSRRRLARTTKRAGKKWPGGILIILTPGLWAVGTVHRRGSNRWGESADFSPRPGHYGRLRGEHLRIFAPNRPQLRLNVDCRDRMPVLSEEGLLRLPQ